MRASTDTAHVQLYVFCQREQVARPSQAEAELICPTKMKYLVGPTKTECVIFEKNVPLIFVNCPREWTQKRAVILCGTKKKKKRKEEEDVASDGLGRKQFGCGDPPDPGVLKNKHSTHTPLG